MTGLNWYYISLAASVPLVVALLLSFPFWWKEQPLFGNLVGTSILFGSAFALIMREHVLLTRGVTACLDAGLPCFPDPPAFHRYAIYAFIALIQAILLFTLSLKVENNRRRRGYAPEWR